MFEYDPSNEPAADRWLELDEDDRIRAILDYHEQLDAGDHPEPGSWETHAVMHAVIETQLASGEPAETREAYEALREEGLNRHTALHALGREVARAMWELNTLDPTEPDDQVVAERMADLDAASVAGEFRGEP
ncbi:MAG: DUF1841 family protein [Bradymonadaceae bacterium]